MRRESTPQSLSEAPNELDRRQQIAGVQLEVIGDEP